MVVCDQPFTAPEQQVFADMVETLNPDAKLYSDKTMRADLIETFDKKFDELKERLSKIPGKMAITMNGRQRISCHFLQFEHIGWMKSGMINLSFWIFVTLMDHTVEKISRTFL